MTIRRWSVMSHLQQNTGDDESQCCSVVFIFLISNLENTLPSLLCFVRAADAPSHYTLSSFVLSFIGNVSKRKKGNGIFHCEFIIPDSFNDNVSPKLCNMHFQILSNYKKSFMETHFLPNHPPLKELHELYSFFLKPSLKENSTFKISHLEQILQLRCI